MGELTITSCELKVKKTVMGNDKMKMLQPENKLP